MNILVILIVTIVLIFMLSFVLRKVNHVTEKLTSAAFIDLASRGAGESSVVAKKTVTFAPEPKKSYKRESEVKQLLEDLTQEKFEKVRPNWLKNPYTGVAMELDAFCERLKIAVETDGRQHAEFTPYFHRSKEDFEKQVVRDRVKNYLCEKNGIKLIRIPHNIKNLREYLMTQLLR